jgi:hypothetical protein
MLRRKISDALLDWKNRPHKCLLLKGQRQVGKTYSVLEFARSNYANYVEYNLSTDRSSRHIFEGDLDVDTLISAMRLFSPDVDIQPGSTLIFIDEIQEFPRAKEALKSFTIDGRYDVIASGSMLGVDIPKDPNDEGAWKSEGDTEPMEPSGYDEHMTMYALDFEEFCWANGIREDSIEHLRKCIREKREIGPAFMDIFSKLFRDFMLIGGMPEAVQTFIDTKDYAKVGRIQNDLIESCHKDINRYNKGIDRVKVLECFESIPAQLSSSNKKFLYSRVDGGKSRNSAVKYKGNLLWIEGAGYGNLVRSLSSIERPLKGQEVRDQFKVYLSDTGMLMEMYGRQTKQDLYSGNEELNNGAIMENVVAECLMKSGFTTWYYRKNSGPGMMEIDMVIELDNEIAAIEVKSGKTRDAPSINKVDKIFKVKRRIKFEKSDISVSEDGIEHYPLFAAGFVRDMERAWDGPEF